jgi:hypothetical protein
MRTITSKTRKNKQIIYPWTYKFILIENLYSQIQQKPQFFDHYLHHLSRELKILEPMGLDEKKGLVEG